ncbi:MAG: ribonuclease P protein component [Verrucomicrobiales bacterium]|nr:ribonuclease P protein component [Verrucomicrobiales bacterium]
MPGPAPKLRLKRAMRIRQRRDFARLRQEGQRLATPSLILNWQEDPGNAIPRMAVITTKKLGPAVVRARARRLLRECFRLHQQALRVPVDLVLVARRGLLGAKLVEVEADYLTALRRANLLKETA